eukprot:CAMPEP_0175062386 /NCGR_PEP_ID=MMETSP0052_2-20121109/14140_1 /TAXON_ID=51329 ORGANISM="Polytomella parva, Strain SAG 63-3" /NCGR_SAMPLE_ID=MMETSP0052_2 /ASSEMBLY_ACC=CAM_ASM_000194 /LENGTH=161 /DNA_ID=CAMNT_0016328403 /DNA_START=27 /DNA_END=512 /DNA_ORIENTATION=+
MNTEEIDKLLKPLTVRDLRGQCRARGLNIAGGLDSLRDKIKEHMIESRDFTLHTENGETLPGGIAIAGVSTSDVVSGNCQNNYVRPSGQNVGNFITDRPSSRVLAAPGGASQIVFGDAPPPTNNNNNYARPGGQNVGNFLTDKNSSRVLAPPGGRSQITFG